MRSLLVVLLIFLSCSGSKVTSGHKKPNKTALTVLKTRQKQFNNYEKTSESDSLANHILNQAFCPDDSCTDGARDSLKAIKNTLRYPKTKYESFLERYYLSIDVFTIESILTNYMSFELDQILVYPSDCRCYNAMAIPLKKWSLPDYYLLEINNGLSLDIGELSKVSSRMLPFKDDSEISEYTKSELKKHLDNDYQTMEDFGVKLVGHLFSDITPDEQSLPVDPYKILYYSTFFRTMKSFVIAHEYSHALLRHKASYSSISFVENDSEVTVDIADYPSKKLELQADSLAFEVIYEYSKLNKNIKKEAVFAAIELWYLWLNMFQKMEILAHGYYKGSNTHPSSIERRNYIRQTFTHKIPTTDEYKYLLGSLEIAFEIYWEFMEPKYHSIKSILRSESIKTECFK